MTKAAGFYRRPDAIYGHSSSELEGGGIYIATEPYVKLELTIPPAELGKSIVHLLEVAKENVPIPTERSQRKELSDPLLALAGIQTWFGFQKRSKHVDIRKTKSGFLFVPYRVLGLGKGFEPAEEIAKCIPANASLESMGKTLLEAFEAC